MPDIRPIVPQVVQPEGVVVSIEPRPMGTSTDESRAQAAERSGGQPTVDHAGKSNDYIAYQSVDLLHSLQHLRSDAYDEMCFYIMGSTKELLFRGLHMELVNARDQVMRGNILNAVEILLRCKAYLNHLTDTWNVLGTISAKGFNAFRDHLATASGQLSYMYRHVEFVLGNKSERLAGAHRNVPHVWPAIKESLETPSLYDEVIRHLHAQDHAIDPALLDRDWVKPYESAASVRAAWLEVYQRSTTDNPEYQLAEMLIQVDEAFTNYRSRHFVTVHKILGYKPGTGGSAGVGWLEHVTKHRFFPELWELRDEL